MTCKQAQRHLLASYGSGRKKGLAAMGQALAALGEPQEHLRIIHVAGTNGKGSFCAMLGAVLAAAGYRAGCFTSPHLQTFHERFAINGRNITDEDFAACMDRVVRAERAIFGEGDGFSYFEMLTLLAFVYFHDKRVDFLLLEVGIGGRLDATNVIKTPLLSVIMSIGMDHMEILGDTIEQIAAEKAGIIKENCPVVLYPNEVMVYNIIADIAMAKNAKIYAASEIAVAVISATPQATEFFAAHEYFGKMGVKLNLAGEMQVQNARCVLAAAVALEQAGSTLPARDIVRGLATVRWPGRMEIVGENPTIVLEGAHNLQGAVACAKNMRGLFANREITLVLGIFADKEYTEMVQTLAAAAKRVVLTKPTYNFRAAPPGELAAAVCGDKEIHVVEDCFAALDLAKQITPVDGVVFCTGSLYLIGDLRGSIYND